jgi:Tfp pilus assembly protein PilO
MQLKNRQQLLAIIAIVGVALLVSDKFVLSPLMAGWKQRTARIVELRKSVNQGSLLLAREQAIRDRWDQMRTNMLPNNVSVAENEVLRAFERWSQQSRLSVTSIKPQWKRTADDYMTLECRADAFGNLEALTRFLYDVERDSLALKVEGVEITTRDNEGQQLSLALQVSGLLLSPQEP